MDENAVSVRNAILQSGRVFIFFQPSPLIRCSRSAKCLVVPAATRASKTVRLGFCSNTQHRSASVFTNRFSSVSSALSNLLQPKAQKGHTTFEPRISFFGSLPFVSCTISLKTVDFVRFDLTVTHYQPCNFKPSYVTDAFLIMRYRCSIFRIARSAEMWSRCGQQGSPSRKIVKQRSDQKR